MNRSTFGQRTARPHICALLRSFLRSRGLCVALSLPRLVNSVTISRRDDLSQHEACLSGRVAPCPKLCPSLAMSRRTRVLARLPSHAKPLPRSMSCFEPLLTSGHWSTCLRRHCVLTFASYVTPHTVLSRSWLLRSNNVPNPDLCPAPISQSIPKLLLRREAIGASTRRTRRVSLAAFAQRRDR